jgi:uncharacterized protein
MILKEESGNREKGLRPRPFYLLGGNVTSGFLGDKTMDRLLHEGVELFNRGEYFECHEVLELAWTPERGPRRLFLQGLIHVAVGFYHHQRANPVGACRQLRKALRKLEAYLPEYEGVNTGHLHRDAAAVLAAIENGWPVAEYPRVDLAVDRAISFHA